MELLPRDGMTSCFSIWVKLVRLLKFVLKRSCVWQGKVHVGVSWSSRTDLDSKIKWSVTAWPQVCYELWCGQTRHLEGGSYIHTRNVHIWLSGYPIEGGHAETLANCGDVVGRSTSIGVDNSARTYRIMHIMRDRTNWIVVPSIPTVMILL
jgi:hypothetical protein